MKRILVPCDFSPTANQAYTFALDIAKKTDGEVFVLHVIEVPFMVESYSTTVPAYLDREVWGNLVREATEAFKKIKSEHSRQNDITFRVVEGQVQTTVLDFIQKENIDLVVMGTKGSSGIDEFLIGSNTEKIVRLAKIPVLAVRKAVNLSSIANIVVPTTLEPGEAEFVGALKDLQALLGATLHLLVINTSYNFKRGKYERSELEAFANQFGLKNYTLNIRDDFSEETGIVNFAEEIKGDMIAMATHGRKGLARLFMGSVTESIVNHVQCPIWTYSTRKK